ncbi:MAG: hypothetical protein HYW69_00415, partial [Candidatus Nealsonbacteria bacterium]|nr:hypothetical protein [Candidatus Nealsonbacteria bacterium]
MDFDEIKNLIEIDGGKFIIVENGKPTIVIASFEEYKKKLIGSKAPVANSAKKPIPKELQGEDLKIEDLPL